MWSSDSGGMVVIFSWVAMTHAHGVAPVMPLLLLSLYSYSGIDPSFMME